MFGHFFGFPRGDISLPLYPSVGLSAANIPLFFESTKFVKQILDFLLQNKSNKANWTNWTPDTRGWTPGGPERQDGRSYRTKLDAIQRNEHTKDNKEDFKIAH